MRLAAVNQAGAIYCDGAPTETNSLIKKLRKAVLEMFLGMKKLTHNKLNRALGQNKNR